MSQDPKTILIVEDEPLHVGIYRDKLVSAGFVVHVAGNEQEAYDILSKVTPDAIIMDLLLPGKSGIDILADLRQDSRYFETPVLIITNFEDAQLRQRARDLKARDFLIKVHVTPRIMLQKVQEIFTNHDTHKNAHS